MKNRKVDVTYSNKDGVSKQIEFDISGAMGKLFFRSILDKIVQTETKALSATPLLKSSERGKPSNNTGNTIRKLAELNKIEIFHLKIDGETTTFPA